MTIEELRELANDPMLTNMEVVQVKLAVAALEEASLLRKAIETHAAVMLRLASGMEHAIEQQFHSVR